MFEEVLVPILDQDFDYEGPEDETFLFAVAVIPGQSAERIDMRTSMLTITIEDNDPVPSMLFSYTIPS